MHDVKTEGALVQVRGSARLFHHTRQLISSLGKVVLNPYPGGENGSLRKENAKVSFKKWRAKRLFLEFGWPS
jgi:hypothetical protein